MEKTDTKALLWQNVAALMNAKYGRENLTRLSREAEFGPATATRIKEQKTSVGLDVIEAIARVFDVKPWQLMAPGLGADLYVIQENRVMPVLDARERPGIVVIPERRSSVGRQVSGGIESIGKAQPVQHPLRRLTDKKTG